MAATCFITTVNSPIWHNGSMLTDKEIAKLREDIVFKATLCDQPFTFHSTWGIFSPRAIDEGTELLLKYIEVNEDDDCLDLGCGTGVLTRIIADQGFCGRALNQGGIKSGYYTSYVFLTVAEARRNHKQGLHGLKFCRGWGWIWWSYMGFLCLFDFRTITFLV